MGKSFVFAASISTLFVSAVASAAPSPLYSYNYNEGSGTTSANLGTGQSFNGGGGSVSPVATLVNLGVPTNLFSANGGGVTGLPGDYALDLSTATGMGTAGQNNSSSNLSARVLRPATAQNLTSFTLASWMKADTTPNGSARLFAFGDGGVAGGFRVTATAAGVYSLNAAGGFAASSAVYTETNAWTFFAVTYDGVANEVKFYKSAGVGLPVTQVGSTVALSGSAGGATATVTANPSYLVFGNAPDNRPFDGFLDNTQVYGATSGSSGALGLTDINAIANVVAVPEPGTLSLAAGVIALATLRRRRAAK